MRGNGSRDLYFADVRPMTSGIARRSRPGFLARAAFVAAGPEIGHSNRPRASLDAAYDSSRVSPALTGQGGAMRNAFISIQKFPGTQLEEMTRGAKRAQPWNRGACRRR